MEDKTLIDSELGVGRMWLLRGAMFKLEVTKMENLWLAGRRLVSVCPMRDFPASEGSSLQDLSKMRPENGSSL